MILTIFAGAVVVFVVGFVLGLLASRKWISVPLWDTVAKLRKELRKERLEATAHELKDWQKKVGALDGTLDAIGYGWVTKDCLEKHSVAHFDLTEPKIERREHSDVFKIASIDALIEGTK